jgi:hypothetical protein
MFFYLILGKIPVFTKQHQNTKEDLKHNKSVRYIKILILFLNCTLVG